MFLGLGWGLHFLTILSFSYKYIYFQRIYVIESILQECLHLIGTTSVLFWPSGVFVRRLFTWTALLSDISFSIIDLRIMLFFLKSFIKVSLCESLQFATLKYHNPDEYILNNCYYDSILWSLCLFSKQLSIQSSFRQLSFTRYISHPLFRINIRYTIYNWNVKSNPMHKWAIMHHGINAFD